jgi:hypothetical protein
VSASLRPPCRAHRIAMHIQRRMYFPPCPWSLSTLAALSAKPPLPPCLRRCLHCRCHVARAHSARHAASSGHNSCATRADTVLSFSAVCLPPLMQCSRQPSQSAWCCCPTAAAVPCTRARRPWRTTLCTQLQAAASEMRRNSHPSTQLISVWRSWMRTHRQHARHRRPHLVPGTFADS